MTKSNEYIKELQEMAESVEVCALLAPHLQPFIDLGLVGKVASILGTLVAGVAMGIDGPKEKQKSFIKSVGRLTDVIHDIQLRAKNAN